MTEKTTEKKKHKRERERQFGKDREVRGWESSRVELS